MSQQQQQKLFLLGASGNIGVQTLTLIFNNPRLKTNLVGISVGRNIFRLIKILEKFPSIKYVWSMENISISIKKQFPKVKFFYGNKQIPWFLSLEQNSIKLNAIQGSAGLIWSHMVLSLTNQKLLLANKESLVLAGGILNNLAAKNNNKIIPVDSEHAAIFSCLEKNNKINKIILTASGGPFVDKKIKDLKKIQKNEVVKHPTWNMGTKISINSAIMINKAYEMIEAFHLFGTKNIEVLEHRQSIVHSAVEFEDYSIKALLSKPDMKQVISSALVYPKRVGNNKFSRIDFNTLNNLTFKPIDKKRFSVIIIAEYCIKNHKYNSFSIALNAINETLQSLFINDRIDFYQYNLYLIKIFKIIKPQKLDGILKILNYYNFVSNLTVNYLVKNIK